MSSVRSTRILFVGDMHLGRRPARLPESLDPVLLGPAAAWRNIVEFAVENEVQAVALAGDLVNQDNDLFEAFGALLTGVIRLTDAGIQVCAVAGNHDTRVLPRLVRHIQQQGRQLHLLGPQGTWSSLTLEPDSAPPVRITGWSFPAPHFPASPLATPPPVPAPGLTDLGLLHTDLDGGRSPYAPVSRQELQAVGYRGWLLGHVHEPGEIDAGGTPFFLGSVVGLDPTETGNHGPVLVEVHLSGEINQRRVPLAPLSWDLLEVTCPEPDDGDWDLPSVLLGAVTTRVRELAGQRTATQAFGFRVHLVGSVDRPQLVADAVLALDPAQLDTSLDTKDVFIEKVTNLVTGNRDLSLLARDSSPPGLLARDILALQGNTPDIPGLTDPEARVLELINQALAELDPIRRGQAFSTLATTSQPLDPDDVRALLIRTGLRALDGLLAAKEVRGAH